MNRAAGPSRMLPASWKVGARSGGGGLHRLQHRACVDGAGDPLCPGGFCSTYAGMSTAGATPACAATTCATASRGTCRAARRTRRGEASHARRCTCGGSLEGSAHDSAGRLPAMPRPYEDVRWSVVRERPCRSAPAQHRLFTAVRSVDGGAVNGGEVPGDSSSRVLVRFWG